jgi:hypothetical protein
MLMKNLFLHPGWLFALFGAILSPETLFANSANETPSMAAAEGPSSSPSAANVDAFLSSSGGMVNDFTGLPSFAIELGSLGGNNGLHYDLSLNYWGGTQHQDEGSLMYSPGSWVGEGFSLGWPQIFADMKGTASLDDDDYYLSLNGSPVKMIGTTEDQNHFVLKNNRFIKIIRTVITANGQTATDPWKNVTTSPPTATFTYSVKYISSWTVSLPDGKTLVFPFSGNCDTDNGVLCTPVIGDKVGYQPFYTLSTNSRVPDQWNIGQINEIDNRFMMAFEYETKAKGSLTGVLYSGAGAPARPTMNSDRAVYLKRVLSYNGTGEEKELVGEVDIERKDKPAGPGGGYDWFGWPAHDPLIRYDTKCLDRILVKSRGKLARTLQFGYGATDNDRLRLEEISSIEPVQGKSRPLKSFRYDAIDTWKLVKVIDGSGTETEFEWGKQNLPSGNEIKSSPQASFIHGKVAFKLEYGNNLFIALDNSGSCLENGKDLVFHYKNNGVNWELFHVYQAPWGGCGGQWFMPQDGSYLGYIQSGSGTVNMNLYELPFNEDMPGGVPKWVNLAGSSYNPQSFTFTGVGKAEVFPFKNWLALHYANSSTISFFHKTSGIWRDGTHNAAGAPISCIVNHEASGSLPGSTTTGCITYAANGLGLGVDVRGGDEMIAVLHRVGPTGSVLRIYGYENGIKEYTDGLRKSAMQKAVTNKSGGVLLSGADTWNEWDAKITDFSVNGRMVVVVSELLSQRYLFAFGWDGYQLRFLHQEILASYSENIIYTGPDYFVRRCVNTTEEDGTGTWYYYKVNLQSWSAVSSNIYPLGMKGMYYWTCKAMAGYFFLEKMSDPSKSFETATISTKVLEELNYPHLGENQLFVIGGTSGELAKRVNFSPWTNKLLGNINLAGDKMTGLVIPAGLANRDWGYFFATLKHGAIDTPVWDVRGVYYPPFTESHVSAYPISSGAIFLEMGKFNNAYYWTGGISFVPENQVWEGDPNYYQYQPQMVRKIYTRTKGSQSIASDGSLKTLAFADYDFQSGTAYYNGMMRAANFGKVTKSLSLPNSVPSDVITTEYLMDRTDEDGDSNLPPGKKSLHGTPVVTETNPSGAGSKKSSQFATIAYSSTPDGLTLKENVYLPFAHTITTVVRKGLATQTAILRNSSVDSYNGATKVAVQKKGSEYSVTIARFEHEFTGAPPYDLVRQKASYLFTSDPCSKYYADDPCANITPATITDIWSQKRAVGSVISKYSEGKFLDETWEWRPAELGVTPLTSLDGNTSSGKWVRTGAILQRNRDVAAARAKDISPTVMEKGGVLSTTFYGGPEAYKLGTVVNADRTTCALLSAEEENVAENAFGSFGEWEPAGSALTTELAHTGTRSIKVTQVFGPTVNINYRSGAGDAFWARKKGFKVSGWLYAKGDINSSTTDPSPCFIVELRPFGQAPKIYDLVAEYKQKGQFPYNRWVKVERLIPFADLNANTPDPGAYLRVWAGKLNSDNTAPVYVDDIRIHPSDATVASTNNFDELGTITSSLDENNEPVFFRYNLWGVLMGAKDKNGLTRAAKASKRFNEPE